MPVLVKPCGDLGCALAEVEPWKVLSGIHLQDLT